MPVKSQSVCRGRRTLTYETTPVMSTYLLAFVIGEYDYVQGKSKEGVQIRCYTPIGKHDMGTFCVEISEKCLTYFNEYFDIEYPMKKMDLVSVNEFNAGAMENWGLITFRERLVLTNIKESNKFDLFRVVATVGHEIAHQWFGDLVTMEWWTHFG
ncbi:puromycin-sensitive aminopeptidase-like protein [Ctenocephalides felis]|uniref:puromycin-sensitive aminopeptidase-like protein n=1 Tax=Ctenocephalides felis TaxID=7515 RepID=UPI000E6E1763|nr:puromycin-sensitive aminopeptidase-like protein [Ctenocephalides felis]